MYKFNFNRKTTAEEIKNRFDEEGITTVDLKYVDLPGRWHHVTLPVEFLTEEVFSRGVGFDGSAIAGFQRKVTGGDMVLVPDKSTAMEDVFWDEPCASFICDIADAGTGEPFTGDPRQVAKRALAYARDFLKKNELSRGAGAVDALFSPEFEFFIFDRVVFTKRDNALGYEFDCEEADWNYATSEHGNTAYQIKHQAGYQATGPRDKTYDLRTEIMRLLTEMDIPVKYHHHEVGGPGQQEIEVLFNDLLRTADDGMWIKYVVQNLAYQNGRTATFMPKPIYGVNGSGLHFHQFVSKADGGSAFAGDDGTGFNRLARAYTAGILKHARSLAAVCCASTNSYKRLVEGYEAPVWLFYGMANREAAVRVPAYAPPEEWRIEFRPSDATGNIYLSLAALLLAGLDGVKDELDPGELGFGPYGPEGMERMSALDGAERKTHLVPRDFVQALHALEYDHDYLKAGGVFDDELIAAYMAYKRENEISKIVNRPHPYEIFLYYDL
jgi:glutamine synthetase